MLGSSPSFFELVIAWWTLYTIEPPSKEKRAKPSIKQKPKLKKPLKRSIAEEEIPDRPRRNVKRQKDDIVEVKQEPQDDILDLSSLSELSSAEEMFDSDNDSNTKNKPNTGKSTKAKQFKSFKKDNASKAKSNEKENEKENEDEDEKQVTDDVEVETLKSKEKGKEKEIKAKVDLEEETAEETLQEKDQPSSPAITEVDDEPNKTVNQVDKSQENIPPSSSETATATSTPDAETNDTHHTKPSKTTDTDTIIIKEDVAPSLSLESKKPTFQNTQKSTSTIGPQLTQQNEWHLLQKLEYASKKLPFAAKRYKRKLAMRRLKRNLGLKLFDLDHQVVQKTTKPTLEPISKTTTIAPASNQIVHIDVPPLDTALLENITYTPYASSFASRLYGNIRHPNTVTRDEPWLSSWNGRKLRPFIRRDFESRPPRMRLMNQIRACNGKPCKKGDIVCDYVDSIDYVYFQKEHLVQVNQMLGRSFWEGIDVSESLLYPEFSVVALYKRKVIACAFMTPEAYITYIAVEIGWENANIGQ
jgi:hypothetical protein